MTVLKPGKLYVVRKLGAFAKRVLREGSSAEPIFMYVRFNPDFIGFPHEILVGNGELRHVIAEMDQWCEEIKKSQ